MDSFQLGQGVFFAASREANSEDPHPRTPVRGSPTTHHPPPTTHHRTPTLCVFLRAFAASREVLRWCALKGLYAAGDCADDYSLSSYTVTDSDTISGRSISSYFS